MHVGILESPVQLLELELHGRFFYPDVGVLVQVVHLGHVAFEVGLREECGKRISGVVSTQYLLYLYMLIRHLLLGPQVLHLDMPCLTSEASPMSNPKRGTGVTPNHWFQNNSEILTHTLQVECMLRTLAHCIKFRFS